MQKKKLSKKDFIKKAAIIFGIVVVILGIDALRGVIEFVRELDEPKKAMEAIKFLEEANLQLPQDPLYGFTFPSTKEMAQKYGEALTRTKAPEPRWLIIIQEKEPRSFIRQFLRLFESESKKEARKSPRVLVPKVGEKGSVYIYLPPSVVKDPPPELARWLYHEGFHLFYQPLRNPTSDQEEFNDEVQPNISDILLGRALANRSDIKDYIEIDRNMAYDQAIRENNREIYEKALKELYELPQDCCIYQPPTNQAGQK